MTGIDPENVLIAAGCNYRVQLTLLAGVIVNSQRALLQVVACLFRGFMLNNPMTVHLVSF